MLINPVSHIPIFQQIVDAVQGSVAAGVYKPDEALPSVRTLALELAVNPNTVQRAYQELERQDLIRSRRGQGMFVAKQSAESARTRAEATIRTTFEHGILTARHAGLSASKIRSIFKHAEEADPTSTAERVKP